MEEMYVCIRWERQLDVIEFPSLMYRVYSIA